MIYAKEVNIALTLPHTAFHCIRYSVIIPQLLHDRMAAKFIHVTHSMNKCPYETIWSGYVKHYTAH